MRIAVNTRFLLRHKMEGFGWFTFETMSRIVRNHPEHEFVFFFDRPFDERFVFAENVKGVVLYPPARHPILFKIWFDYSVTRALKKYNCDAFISLDGYVSLKTKVPQLSVIHDLNFEHNPLDIPREALRYLKRYFPLFAKKAKRIVTVSEFSKQDICTTYKINPEKIDVVWNGASPLFQPISADQQVDVRKVFTNGKPFVLTVGAIHKRKNLARLIEAFALVKEEHQNDIQLLVVGEAMWKNQALTIPNSVKNDIHFTGHIELATLAQVTATAKILTFVSYFEGFGIPLVEAMQSGTPVLAANVTALPEIGGDAVHYCDPFNVKDIAQQLNHLLTSDEYRKSLISKGLERAKQFSWDKTADGVWSSFERMMEAQKCD